MAHSRPKVRFDFVPEPVSERETKTVYSEVDNLTYNASLPASLIKSMSKESLEVVDPGREIVRASFEGFCKKILAELEGIRGFGDVEKLNWMSDFEREVTNWQEGLLTYVSESDIENAVGEGIGELRNLLKNDLQLESGNKEEVLRDLEIKFSEFGVSERREILGGVLEGMALEFSKELKDIVIFKAGVGMLESDKYGLEQRLFANVSVFKNEIGDVVREMGEEGFGVFWNEKVNSMLARFKDVFYGVAQEAGQVFERKLKVLFDRLGTEIDKRNVSGKEAIRDVRIAENEIALQQQEKMLLGLKVAINNAREEKELVEKKLDETRAEIARVMEEFNLIHEKRIVDAESEIRLVEAKTEAARAELSELNEQIAALRQELAEVGVVEKVDGLEVEMAALMEFMEVAGLNFESEEALDYLGFCEVDTEGLKQLSEAGGIVGLDEDELLKIGIACLPPEEKMPEFSIVRNQERMVYCVDMMQELMRRINPDVVSEDLKEFNSIARRTGLAVSRVKTLYSPKHTPTIRRDEILNLMKVAVGV